MVEAIDGFGPFGDALAAQLRPRLGDAAAEQLAVTGLPGRRIEAYHYTDLKTLIRDLPDLAGVDDVPGVVATRFEGAARFSIDNGRPAHEEKVGGLTASFVDGAVSATRDDPVLKLNEALGQAHLALTVAEPVAVPIHIAHRVGGGRARHVQDGVVVEVKAGARAVVIETFEGDAAAHVGNHASRFAVGAGAELTHVIVERNPGAARHLHTVEYALAGDAKLRNLIVHAGAGLARTQVFADFDGGGTHADFAGLNLVEGEGHADITLDVAHSVPDTTSTERFKSVARGRGKAVFQGKIVVARDAQRTDAQMMSNGLLLSETAQILTKPELEIYADDVICAHGATCGALDETHLFYLMSRGIPRAVGEVMLTRAFLAEQLDPFVETVVHPVLAELIDSWLARVGAA